LDTPHSWTYTQDVAATLVAAAASSLSWGRAWHVPSSVASVRELELMAAQLTNRHEPTLRRVGEDELQKLADADSMMREAAEMCYRFDEPCVLDSRQTQGALGVIASPLRQALQDNLDS
jgi:nucleoside-diphosphate-sugar epimerase